MTLEQVVIWIIVGGIAGLIAEAIVKVRTGLVGAVIIGILGALLGGWLFGQLHIAAIGKGIISEIITAAIGAIVLLFILRLLRRL